MKEKDFLNAQYNPSGLMTRVSVIDRFENGTSTEKDGEYFYKKYRPLIIAIGRNKRMSDEDIKELISRVFQGIMTTFLKIANGERDEIQYSTKHGKGKKFRNYFTTIILNQRAAIYKERYKREEYSEDEEVLENQKGPEQDEDIQNIWQKFILREALQDLQDEMDLIHFKVFFQVKMVGKKGPEVAKKFNMTADNVNQICSRAQKKLLTIIRELSEENPVEKMEDDEMCLYIRQVDKEFQTMDDEFRC